MKYRVAYGKILKSFIVTSLRNVIIHLIIKIKEWNAIISTDALNYW